MASVAELFIALIFLLMNAAFVLAEFALVKVRFTRLEELAASGNPAAVMAKDAVKNLDGYLAAIQLGITMASLGLGWIGEPALAKLLAPGFHAAGLNLTLTRHDFHPLCLVRPEMEFTRKNHAHGLAAAVCQPNRMTHDLAVEVNVRLGHHGDALQLHCCIAHVVLSPWRATPATQSVDAGADRVPTCRRGR